MATTATGSSSGTRSSTAGATQQGMDGRMPDTTYNLISLMYHTLQSCQTYEQYARDAEQSGQRDIAQFFRDTGREFERCAQRGQELLAQCLQQGQGGRARPGQLSGQMGGSSAQQGQMSGAHGQRFVIKTGLKLAGPIIRGIKGISGKVKAKVAAGKAWVKGKVDAGKQWVKGKVDSAKSALSGKPGDDRRTPAQKQAAVDRALRDVDAVMSRPGSTRSTVAAALNGIRRRHKITELKLVDSAAAGHYHAHAALNPSGDTKDAKDADVTGMVAAYRGLHFKATWTQEQYDKTVATSLVGKPTFSAAAEKFAEDNAKPGTELSDDDKMTAALYILDEVKKAKTPSAVRQWWKPKTKVFDSIYHALLMRYINSYEAFHEDAAAGKAGGFSTSPFISTSKNPVHAARYALTGKFLKEHEIRKTGTVGRAFVYLFSLKRLADQDPANVKQLRDQGKILLRARLVHEGEVTFSGAVPGENLVSEHDAEAGVTAEELGGQMQKSAADKASAEGGLKSWD